MEDLKRTALYSWHVENGANIAPFGQYEMPLWYTEGVKAEHMAVIERAGIFDTSHMAVVTVLGEKARDLLQHVFSKDLDRCTGLAKKPLAIGRCVYGVFMNVDGTVLDDAIVYQTADTGYVVVVNAGMGADIAGRLHEYNAEYGAEITDLTDQVGKMDIQGPLAAKVLAKLIRDPEKVFEKMAYFSFKGSFDGSDTNSPVTLTDGTPFMLSRTGYTGEFGFELFVAKDHFVQLWEAVVEAGSEFTVLPCGLAARDSLRAGAVLPLSHQDVGAWPFAGNPWSFALAWNDEQDGFTKKFVGSEAILSLANVEYTLPFAGYNPRKIAGNEVFVTDLEGNRIGRILTCATDMAIGRVGDVIYSIASSVADGKPDDFTPKGLSCGFVQVDRNLAPGSEVVLTDGKKKKIKVEIRADVRPGRTARKPMKEMV